MVRVSMEEMKAGETKLMQALKGEEPLVGRSREELRELAARLEEPAYRGDQLYRAIYAERVTSIDAMTALPAEMRRRLAESTRMGLPEHVAGC